MARKLTHAGGVTFRKTRDQILFLMVSSSNGIHWVFPKGHIESGESPELAVLREIKEEAGVQGRIVRRLSVQEFEKPTELVMIQYFLIRELAATESAEKRTVRWENGRAALELLDFEDDRSALKDAAIMLCQLEGQDADNSCSH